MAMKEEKVSVIRRMGAMTVLVGFVAVGGLLGHLFYQCLQIFGRVNDVTTHVVAIAVGAVLTGAVALWLMKRSVNEARERVTASGGDPSDMSFMSFFAVAMMSDSSSSSTSHGGSDISSGATDWSGGSHHGSGFSDSGGFSGGDSGSF